MGDTFLFEGFRLDRRTGLSRKADGAWIPVTVGSRAFDVLGILVERHGDLVSKDEIMRAVWPGTVVEDSNLTVQISTLRRILDRGRAEGSCIQTVVGRGYRFVGAVTRCDGAAKARVAATFYDDDDGADRTAGLGSPEIVALTGREAAVVRSEARPRNRFGRPLSIAISLITCALAVAVIAAFWISDYRWFDARRATPSPRLSIVVLPLKNLSDDRVQQYFADGVTENLTTDLSRIEGSFVISRNTAYMYKDKSVDTKRVGRELGVRYVVEGSLQRSDKQISVNVQLINAETDTHLWAERFAHDVSELFALQDEITSRIAVTLKRALIGAEAARRPADPDAVDYILQARAVASEPPTPDGIAKIIGLYERALARDPRSAEATTRLAYVYAGRVLLHMSATPNADLVRAQDLLGRASPDTSLAHWAKGQLLRAQGRYTDAIPEYEATIALDHNLPSAYANLAQTKLLTGSLQEVVPLVEQAIRRSPRDPDLGYWYDLIGLTHLLQSRTDEAIVWLEKARSASPARPFIHADLAAAYGLKGDGKRAAAALTEARSLNVDPRAYSSIARLGRLKNSAQSVRALVEATYDLGMRKAGMPEQ